MSLGGMLINEDGVTFGDIGDGSSNTLLLGEQSDFIVHDDRQKTDARSNLGHGFNAGARSRPRNRMLNITTISAPINEKILSRVVGAAEHGADKPLLSAHPGGVNVSLSDGSVHFLNEGLDLATLFNLADRNDGNVTSIDQ
ncbi:DUF1559 domain-containing protein [Mariniblastus fucicola]|uniref:DUF1559 domain-containing protein n=1 Tax=Mariniblastus fucicola TaxID=980251 RepID=UPI0021BBCCEC|nr:DUF1559 domain-containing protein [Mariniblastus fucicola]